MRGAVKFVAFLAALVIATSAWAQARGFEGSVTRVDRDADVIVLEDGQAVRIGPNTVVMYEERTMTIAGLQPGMRVIIRDGEPVTMRDGRYVTSAQMQPGVQQPMQQPRVTINQEQLTATVQAPQQRISVEVPPQQVIVQQQPAEIVVRQSEPQVQLQPAPQPQVRFEGQRRAETPAQGGVQAQQQPMHQQPAASPPAQVQMQPQDLTATVQAPQPRISVEVPPQRVIVQQQPAEIVVRQAEPQVTVQPAPQPQVRFEGPRAEAAPPAATVVTEPRVTERQVTQQQVTQQQPPVVRQDFPATAVPPAPVVSPWCEGAYAETLGTNFGSCVGPAR